MTAADKPDLWKRIRSFYWWEAFLWLAFLALAAAALWWQRAERETLTTLAGLAALAAIGVRATRDSTNAEDI